jgi:hypothetical protein
MYLMPQSVQLQQGRARAARPPLSHLGTYRRPMPLSQARAYRTPAYMLRGLGQIDPSIQSQYFPKTSGTAGFTTTDLTNWQTAVEAQQLPAYYEKTPGDCGTPIKAAVSTPAIVSSAVGGALLKVGGATGPAAPFVLAAGAALEVLGDVFGIFSGAHSAAVAKEETELCQTVPAVNSALQAVQSGISGGFLTSAQAGQSLENILQAFQTNTANIMKMSGSSCNAACVYYRMLEGIVAQWKENLVANPAPADAGPASAAEAGVSTEVSTLASSTGLPSWVFYGVGLFALWKLL